MADDIRSDIIINVDTSVGIAEIKNLQRQISQLNTQLIQSGARQAKAAQDIQRNLRDNINATGKFAANVRTISTTAESFTTALERNKLGFGETFRYAGASTKTFGRLFKSEFATIEKVAAERVKTLQTQFIKLGRDGSGAMKAIAVRPLALDMENLSTKTAIAAQKQQLFNQLLKQGSTNLLNFGKNTQWAGRQLMVGFTIPLAMMGSVAAKTFMQMEEQAIKFRRVYGDTFTATEETEKMIKQVQRLASEFTKYGVQAEKTMEMAATAAAMGLTNADLLAQVNQATRLAVLGGVEQEQALETTISLMNAFGIEARDLAGRIDFLNAVENQTVVAIEDMTIAIPKAAPVIKQLGGDMEDLAFFMTAMKEGGINASEGANALKSGLASLINPAEKTSRFLADLGINIKGIVDANAGDVRGLVIGFANALDTLDPLNRARAIEQLFGKFQFARLSTLFQNVVKEGTQAQRVAEISRQTAEELAILSERELKRVEDSPMFKFKKSIEDLKVSLVPLGEAFLKAITPVVEFATGLLNKFNEMGDGAKNFVVILTTLFAGIGPVLLMSFGLIANGVANLIKMFSFIGKVFRGTGNSSKDLAFSTEYLTQQQLEASAVAASLDQSHAKLIQTFNVEALAVDKLASAYARAVTAQSRLLGVPIGPKNPAGQKPMKLRTGIVSVPGPKGAGDIVPAMLSPGEAVIPAKQSEKYSGLIRGMINDDIPGYRFGRLGAAASGIMGKVSQKIGNIRVMRGKNKTDLDEWNKLNPNSKWSLPEAIVRTLTGRRGSYGPSITQYENRFAERFLRGRGKKVAVRMFSDDLIGALGRGDKRYQSIFERGGVSRGSGDAASGQRALAEEKLFGLAPDAPASARPAYGYLFKEERGVSRFSKSLAERISGRRDPNEQIDFARRGIADATRLMNESTYRYGDVAMVLKNRALRGRTTMTQGDSLNAFMNQYSTPAKLGTRNREALKAATPTGLRTREFFEAQILGGFSFKDIKRIVATEPQTILALQQALKQAGIRGVRVGMPKFTMMQRLKKFVYGKRTYDQKMPRLQPDGKYGLDPTPRRFFSKGGLVAEGTESVSKPGKLRRAIGAQAAQAKKIGQRLFEGTVFVQEAEGNSSEFKIPNAKSEREVVTIQKAINDLVKTEGQKGRDIARATLETFGSQEKFDIRSFQKYGVYTAERLFGDRADLTKIGRLLGETPTQQANMREAPRSKGDPTIAQALQKEDPRQLKAWLDLNQKFYDAALTDPQTDAEFKKFLNSKNAEVQSKLANWKSMGLSDNQIERLWKEGKARSVTNFDPRNPMQESGLARGHLEGVPKSIKRFGREAWQHPFTATDSRTINGFISSLTDNTGLKETATMRIVRKYQQKAKLSKEVSGSLLSKLSANSSLGVDDLKNLRLLLDAVPENEANRNIRMIRQGLAGADFDALAPKVKPLSPEKVREEFGKRMLGGKKLMLRGKVFGFNKGVVSVPGPKGKGDIIPAMLTPGEAVIPAPMAQKYAPLIQDMIVDNVPGFAKGTPFAGKIPLWSGPQKPKKPDGSVLIPADKAKKYRVLLSAILGGTIRGFAKGTPFAGKIPLWSGPQKPKKPDGSVLIPADKAKKYRVLLSAILGGTIRGFNSGVVSVPGPKGKGDIIPAMLSPGEAVIPAAMSEKYAPLISGMISDSIPGYNNGLDPFNTPKDPFGRSQGTVGARPTQSNPFVPTDSEVKRSGTIFGRSALSAKNVAQGAKNLASGFVEGSKTFGKWITGDEATANRLTEKWDQKVDRAVEKAEKTRLGKAANNSKVLAAVTSKIFSNPITTTSGVTFEDGIERKVDKAGREYFTQPGVGRISKDAAMARVKPADPKLTVRERYGNAMGRVTGGVGMASGGAMMGAMMLGMGEGPMAKMANDLMPALLAASIAIPLMGSIAGAVAVALGSTVAAILLLNSKFDEAQKKVVEYSETMKASNQAIQGLAEFAGNVTASEAMDRRRAERDRELGAVSGKTTFGEAFIETEAGKKQAAELSKQIASGNRAGSVKDMTSQLTSAVLSGAMNFSQARSVAANLSAEAGDASIAIDVIANMEQLLGPDGTDLLKDPLGVRINALEANQKSANQSLLAATNAARPGLFGAQGSAVDRGATILGAAAAGAGTGAALGSLATPLGAVIGSIIGGIAGAATAYFSTEKTVEEYGKLGAVAAVDAKIALEQNKELLDSMDMFYEKKIRELRIQGKINEANKLQGDYMRDRKILTDQMASLNEDILRGFNESPALQESLMSGARKATDARFKDDPDQIAFIDAVRAQGSQLGLTQDLQYLVELKMSSGEIPPMTMRKLLGIAAGDDEAKTAVIDIMTKFSGDVAGRTAELGAMLGDEKLARELTLKVKAQGSDGEAQDVLNNISELTRLNSVIPANVAVNFYLTDTDAYNDFNELMDKINEKKPKTIKAVLEIAPELKGKISEADQAYFNTLKDDQKEVYVKTLVSQLYVPEPQIIASEDYKKWLTEDQTIDGYRYGGAQFKGLSQNLMVAHYRAQEAFKASQQVAAVAPKTPGLGGGGGGGARNEPLDDPLRRLREIRDSRINAKGGRKELMRLLGANKDITRFKGLEQLLLEQGGSSAFVDYLMGLDEADQKKFFTVNKKTGKLTLTPQGEATDKAFDEIAIGEFQVTMRQATIDVRNQNTALMRMVAAGMSVSEAYAAIEDTALAAAVASKNLTNEELKAIVEEAKRAERALREFAAVKAIREDITNTNRDLRVTELFAKGPTKRTLEGGKVEGLDFAEQQAILQDSTLREIYGQFLAGEIDSLPADFRTRLNQIVNSIEFKEGLFTDGLNKAMDKFEAQERSIEIKAELSIVEDRRIAEQAQNEISELQFELDDYQAGLQEIAWQEEEINKAYEKKYEALDKIEQVNQRITAQQQKQLSLADALSRGDIAAAARAAQEMRDQSARDAVASQRESLQRAQKLQTDALLSKSGMTREQLDKRILSIQKSIFEIEETRLEPAQENIRRAEAAANVAKQGLKVGELTRLQWEEISNGVNVAKTGSEEYGKAIQGALKIVEKIEDYYNTSPAQRESNVRDIAIKDISEAFNQRPPAVTTQPSAGGSGNNTGSGSGGKKDDPVTTRDDSKPTTSNISGIIKSLSNDRLSRSTATNLYGFTRNRQAKLTAAANILTQARKDQQSIFGKYNLDTRKSASGQGPWSRLTAEQKTEVQAVEKRLKTAQQEYDKYKTSESANAAASNILSSLSKDIRNAVETLRANSLKLVELRDSERRAKKALDDYKKQVGNSPLPAEKAKMKPLEDAYLKARRDADNHSKSFVKPLEVALGRTGIGVQELKAFGIRGYSSGGIIPKRFAMGGKVNYYPMGGLIPYKSEGGSIFKPLGTDTVPAMLTPGEFVMRKYAVENFGVDRLKSINNGTYKGDSMYNYEVNVNVQTDSNPDQIARAVIGQIKQIDAQRIRGNRF